MTFQMNRAAASIYLLIKLHMGNVLIRFDPELFMDRYSLTGEDRKLIRNEVFRSVEWRTVPSPPWYRCRGLPVA